jgi:pilus assembly protein CpaE
MSFNPPAGDAPRRPDLAWKIGLVLDSPEILSGIMSALADTGAVKVFQFPASTSSFEIANAADRDKPDLLFVELSLTSRPAAEWISDVRRGEETPLVVAVHQTAEPLAMISALRAGASEFLSLPVRPAIYEAMERVGALLEARRSSSTERGKIAGVLSAKGGCGATSIACYLGAALHPAANLVTKQSAAARGRVLVADLDYQSPGTGGIFRVTPQPHAGGAFDAVRRLSSSVWREFVTPVAAGVDLLASPVETVSNIASPPPEPWRVESLFRFVGRQYDWILVDLGRHLNPANWSLLQNIDELFIVTAPDVLALYQTRSVLQTLSNRGFDKGRVRIILNRNLSSPQDFWVESIEQMFEMNVFAIIPNDEGMFEKLPRDRFEYPTDTPFGRALTKMATRLATPNAPGPARRAA